MAGRKKRPTDGGQSDSAQPPCYDVFISYSSKDKEWVRGELLTRIEQAGLKAYIDFRDFTRGAPSIKEMERGVTNCTKTLLVLTPNYLDSGWTEIENIMVQTLDPANHGLRLIPLLKTKCKKPLRIGALTHIDFTKGADLDLAWRQLLTALGAPPVQEPPKEPERDQWFLAHPYPMPPNFTGRVDERKTLSHWLDADATHPLFVLRALGGFGKSALVWHWLLHDVAPSLWPHVVWWSFYEGDNSFDHFVEQTLDYLATGDTSDLGPRQRLDALLDALHKARTLLVLDGFERALRAFGGLDAPYQGDEVQRPDAGDRDCISLLAEHFLRGVATLPGVRAKVLLTTRLRPVPVETRGGILLEGCREEELRQMQPADAVALFHAQGIRGTRAEIETACEPYGYHPLSLRLLAGWIIGDLQQPGDIAAAKRLDVNGDLVARQHHVLEQAYDCLTPAQKTLLGRIACFRTPVTYDTLKALAETPDESPKTLDADLRDLAARGLLHHDTKKARFDLHPIVRRYAYDRLGVPDRTAAHVHLRDYFAAVPQPDKVTRLEDLAPVIELYHHTIHAGQLDEAHTLFRDHLHTPLYFQLGAYQLTIDLLRALFADGEDRPPRLKTKRNQSWAACALANSYSLSGQPRRAVPLFEVSARLDESVDDRTNLAIDLGNVAHMTQLQIGAMQAAEANLRRSIALCREIKDEFRETAGHQELGRLLVCRGAYAESETETATALRMFEKQNNVQGEGVVLAYRALFELLRLREAAGGGNVKSALAPARRAMELADEWQKQVGRPNARDYVRAHWLLGAAHRVACQHNEAERHLHEALERCRRINMVDHEANILIDLARLRVATGSSEEAQRLAEEALLITERCGYVLQGADAHLELAKLAFARGDKTTGLDHAQRAKELATCDGPPDYTYKAAYDEACALLKEHGGSSFKWQV
ncbi:MAG: toll/interleukin-1 receptor domain-containing protein [Phycisphaerales bacterium]